MKKGQSAIEFIMLTGAVFFIFVSFIGIIYVSIEKKNYEKKDISLLIESQYLADEIALAHQAGEGYVRNFTLPSTILGENYVIEIIEKDSIYAITTDGKHATSISCLNTVYKSKTSEDRYIIDSSGPNTIKNINGVVNISNSKN